jgi:uncharacterized membrane protein
MCQSADEVMQAEALFASHLQTSDTPDPEIVDRVVTGLLQRDGAAGCAARMAYEYGEYPDTAAQRMRWARQVVHRQASPTAS